SSDSPPTRCDRCSSDIYLAMRSRPRASMQLENQTALAPTLGHEPLPLVRHERVKRRREQGLDVAACPPRVEGGAQPHGGIRGILIEKTIADLQPVILRGCVAGAHRLRTTPPYA